MFNKDYQVLLNYIQCQTRFSFSATAGVIVSMISTPYCTVVVRYVEVLVVLHCCPQDPGDLIIGEDGDSLIDSASFPGELCHTGRHGPLRCRRRRSFTYSHELYVVTRTIMAQTQVPEMKSLRRLAVLSLTE